MESFSTDRGDAPAAINAATASDDEDDVDMFYDVTDATASSAPDASKNTGSSQGVLSASSSVELQETRDWFDDQRLSDGFVSLGSVSSSSQSVVDCNDDNEDDERRTSMKDRDLHSITTSFRQQRCYISVSFARVKRKR